MTMLTEQILKDLETLPPEMQAETQDFVRFLKSKLAHGQSENPETEELNGKKISCLMERMAARSHGFSNVDDPMEWQGEIRKDRLLPGRED
ncbi:MAG: DUF2281 domain-containing protein [Candidatus Hydrogenedentes bacterium]|nr:DUF2281 domain-containing protein [Candidatus Hydrogenedentota bacterium]